MDIRATRPKRIIALLLDYLILGAPILIIMYASPNTFRNFELMNIIVITVNILFFLKDITGQSPGKKILKIKIVDRDNHSIKPNPLKLIARTLLLSLGIIEIMVFLFDSHKERLGDKLTKSIVINA